MIGFAYFYGGIIVKKSRRNWGKKDWLGLCIIPLELIFGVLLEKTAWFQTHKVFSDIFSWCVFMLGFVVTIYLFKSFLKRQWRHYRRKLWKKLAGNALLTVGIFLLLAVMRVILPKPLAVGNETVATMNLGVMFLASLVSFVAPFSEELTFRYLLFGKINPRNFRIFMFFVSSILFGLIHWQNFGGDWLLTIPYMVIGAYLAIVYRLYNNIWGSIMTHWMFNTINSVLPVIFVAVFRLFGGEIG